MWREDWRRAKLPSSSDRDPRLSHHNRQVPQPNVHKTGGSAGDIWTLLWLDSMQPWAPNRANHQLQRTVIPRERMFETPSAKRGRFDLRASHESRLCVAASPSCLHHPIPAAARTSGDHARERLSFMPPKLGLNWANLLAPLCCVRPAQGENLLL